MFERFTNGEVIRRLYNSCAEDLRPLNYGQAPDVVWQQALDVLAQVDLLSQLFEVIAAEGPLGTLAEPIEQVRAALPLVDTRVVTSDVLVLDRQPLRDRLGQLGANTNPAKVVLVRGRPKSGKTHGRYLFELAAHDQGADALYLSFGMVTDVEEAVLWLFSSLGAPDDAIPPGDSTQNAWYLKVSMALLRWVSGRGRPAWIAVDDLGPGPDGTPLMDEKIRKFFERLAVKLLNPTFRPWLRLMLIHYPDGPPPTGWHQDLWCDHRLDGEHRPRRRRHADPQLGERSQRGPADRRPPARHGRERARRGVGGYHRAGPATPAAGPAHGAGSQAAHAGTGRVMILGSTPEIYPLARFTERLTAAGRGVVRILTGPDHPGSPVASGWLITPTLVVVFEFVIDAGRPDERPRCAATPERAVRSTPQSPTPPARTTCGSPPCSGLTARCPTPSRCRSTWAPRRRGRPCWSCTTRPGCPRRS